MVRSKTPVALPDALRILPEIRGIIEASRRHVAVAANLAMVNLYWNIGRIVTQDIQKKIRRAGYGDQLLSALGEALIREYGRGYSVSNLNDMRRFHDLFEILQTASVESSTERIRKTVPDKSRKAAILQTASVGSSARLQIDFRKHLTLGWSHYRLLLGQHDFGKRKFYFEQATAQRWSVRELQRKIDGALFERVALSRETSKLVALEKKKGAPEVGTKTSSRTPTSLTSWG